MKWWLKKLIWKMEALQKGYGFKRGKRNSISIPIIFLLKNPYSFLDLILWVLKITYEVF
jgi:hypothetical protein